MIQGHGGSALPVRRAGGGRVRRGTAVGGHGRGGGRRPLLRQVGVTWRDRIRPARNGACLPFCLGTCTAYLSAPGGPRISAQGAGNGGPNAMAAKPACGLAGKPANPAQGMQYHGGINFVQKGGKLWTKKQKARS